MIYRGKFFLLMLLMCLLGSACTTSASANLKPVVPPAPQSSLDGQTGLIFLPLLASPSTYYQTFDGEPNEPKPWQPATWDVTVHSRDSDTWKALEPMHAAHGMDCSAPPASHTITDYEDAVFQCRDHVMTSLNAKGYGVIYLTPNQMVNFGDGEAVVSWDMSTLRTSQRDWVDLWITPYAENLQLPLESWLPDLQGEPRNAIHIRMDTTNGQTIFKGEIIRNFVTTDVTTNNWTGYETVLTPSAKRRDRFELRISRNYIKFGMPQYNLWWVDTKIDDLGWSTGVVQFGHHSYNPMKDCSDCAPNTWHWDNVMIDPAVPFTIIRASQRSTDATSGGVITLPAPAPADARLRFAGIGKQLEVSFDDGKTWQAAQRQAQPRNVEEQFSSYWTPIPPGTQQVLVRGEKWWGGEWTVRDISVWSQRT